ATASGAATSLPPGAGPAEVYAAAGAGDPVALDIARGVGRHLARAIRGVVLAYGVDRVVVGGGMSRAGQPFLEPILDELERERADSGLVRHAMPAEIVELLSPETDAGAWGAVVIARSGLRAVPPEPSWRREVDDG
ncbi:MAG: ROK family protein, partial [Candidatus Limnocylindria bacterium]